MPGTWVGAGGTDGWDIGAGPPSGHPVWQPEPHLQVALPWMCGNLRAMARHIEATGKPISALVAMAVCHIAGCSRITESISGIPQAGEAGCRADCVSQIHAYLDSIEHWVQEFAAPLSLPLNAGSPAQPYTGGSTGCVIPDPTGTGGCVTGATAWMLAQVQAALPAVPVACWDRHAWNPTSDHPLGKACDFVFGQLGHFPGEADKAAGWVLASWMQQNATALRVAYVIWQGHIWSVQRATEGWRVYDGGGIYDPTEPTGGHYDHVHVSMAM